MLELTLLEVARICGGRLADADPSVAAHGVSTDSRRVRPGQLFVGLPGANYDGADYAEAAVAAGAVCALVGREGRLRCPRVVVDDPLAAFGWLGAQWRRRFVLPAVAITGSCGKTTTKEMLASILSVTRRICAPPASYNNAVGVPTVLCGLGPEHEALVIELGMNAPGEIGALALLAAPTIGVITNVGPAHIGAFKSLAEIAAEKVSLAERLGPGGCLIVNADDPLLARACAGFKGDVVRFGLKAGDFRAGAVVETASGLSFSATGIGAVTIPLQGRHNVYNALAAAAAALATGLVGAEEVREGLSRVRPAVMRLERRQVGGRELVLDCYNANPASLRAALGWLAGRQGRRVAVLGTMRELGAFSDRYHEEAGRDAAACGLDLLICVGDAAHQIAEGAREVGMDSDGILVCLDAEEAARLLAANTREGDIVLIKGSRVERLERVADEFGRLVGCSTGLATT